MGALRDCFDYTDWGVLLEEQEMDIDRRVNTITDYKNFCRDTVIPVSVRCYPNNKPWITSDIRGPLNQKKRAFQDEDKEKQRSIQQELKKALSRVKVEYKKKMERQLDNNNTREVWSGMRVITGYKLKNSQPVEGDVDRANIFNHNYNRFDSAASSTCAAATSTSAAALSTLPPLRFPPNLCSCALHFHLHLSSASTTQLHHHLCD